MVGGIYEVIAEEDPINTPHQTLGLSNQWGWDGQGMAEVHAGVWWKNVEERDHLKYLNVGGRNILKYILIK